MDGNRQRWRGLLWFGLLCTAVFPVTTGCGTKTPSAPPPGEFDPRRYGELPGLSAVPLAKLADEHARIVEERGTPELLCSEDVPDGDNVAAGLNDLFEPEKVEALLIRANELCPPPGRGFSFDPIRLQRAAAFRKTHDSQRVAARYALRRSRCDFGIDHMAGQYADLAFVDVVWLLARLEAFKAAEQLQSGDVDGAIETLGFMLRLAECLAAEKHVVPRGQGGLLREEALLLLQAIVGRPEITRAQLDTLYELVRGQLTHWPDDAGAWQGDRALGMHTYEMVRDGHLMMLVLADDVERFGGEDAIDDLPAAAQRTVNEDELYYLETMRKIIESCQKPYCQRVQLFEEIRGDLQARHGTAEMPLVASHFLLPDIETAHAAQARDRALCEAWALALALACGKEPPDYKIDPSTGQPYEVVRDAGRVEVSAIGSGRVLVVPDLSAEPKSSP